MISSAYKANLLLYDRGRLQTESIKMDPCGTLDVTSQVSEVLPLITTLWVLPDR